LVETTVAICTADKVLATQRRCQMHRCWYPKVKL